MKKPSLRISMIATPMMIVCGLLVSGASGRAESEDGACSNRTLRGDYGSTVEGLVLLCQPREFVDDDDARSLGEQRGDDPEHVGPARRRRVGNEVAVGR